MSDKEQLDNDLGELERLIPIIRNNAGEWLDLRFAAEEVRRLKIAAEELAEILLEAGLNAE